MVTTQAQREAQKEYNERQKDRGYFQTRPWLPEELKEWHQLLVKRAREWKEFGTPIEVPPLPRPVTKPNKKPLARGQ